MGLGSQFILSWDRRKRRAKSQEFPSDAYDLVPGSAQPQKTSMRARSSYESACPCLTIITLKTVIALLAFCQINKGFIYLYFYIC